jgi:CBS domain-containing protein
MRSPIITASSSESAFSIAQKMVANNIGAIIIMFQGVKAGIITERDLIKRVIVKKKDSSAIRAQDIMSSPLITIKAKDSVSRALKLMKEKRIRRLAVTKNGKLIGIITERRLLDSIATLV